jgi:DNA-binding LytR/AlgR family response regulator
MSDFFFAKENQSDSYKKIAKSEISYLKADSSYTDVYINEKTLKVSKNLKHTLEDLNYDKLIRINRSVAINIDSIKSIEGSNSVHLFGINQSFVITKEFKEEFNNMINKL